MCSAKARRPRRAGLLPAALLIWLSVPLAAAAAEALVPPPANAFTPQSVLTLYVDAAAISQSAIGKALSETVAAFTNQLANVPGMPAQLPAQLPALASLQGAEVAELAVAADGAVLLQSLQSGKMDPKSGFVAVARLTKAVDQEALITELLAALEQQRTGLSNEVASTRTRVGSAELFRLPTEALGGAQLPFPVSAAIGPGKDGTVIGVGRHERLEDFLQGRTTGRLPESVGALLPRRGQVWLFLPVPADAAKSLPGAGGSGPNPMMAGLAQGFDQVREVGLNLTFGSSAIDIELALGCTDAAAAKNLSDGTQGFVSMVQMSAAQNPSAAPGPVSKLKVGASGKRFLVTTTLTQRDVEQALKSVSPGFKPAKPAGAPKRVPEAAPVAEAALAPVAIEFMGMLPSEGEQLRRGKMRIKNSSPKAVQELRVTYQYLDDAGHRIGEWTRVQRDSSGQILVRPDSERIVECLLFEVPLRTEKVALTLREVTFADGERWSPPR